MQIHKTKGIVLRSVKYGDTSIIASIYTELFGVQSYLVKGVRTTSKKSQGKAHFFQPAAMLDMQVYHNELKQLQFIKDFQWAYLYQNIFSNVVRNAVALYLIEILQHSIKQPEANPELFYLIEEGLLSIDKDNDTVVANIPIYFTMKLAAQLGFELQGEYSNASSILDLKEGLFIDAVPTHPHYIDGELSQIISAIANASVYTAIGNVRLNKEARKKVLQACLDYFILHVHDFGEMRSLPVLRELLG
jgi:DNA repair protein RecO (recombination protein O)